MREGVREMFKGFFQNCACPKGLAGKLMVAMMNYGPHAALAKWAFQHIQIAKTATALDVGCGGGGNVRRLLVCCENGHVVGVDQSEISVEKSRSYNEEAIRSGQCEIRQADVAELPFPEATFDVVTAFETVYFWPGLEKSFREIFRVMKPGGVFLVSNESTGHDKIAEKFSRIIDGMVPYTVEDIGDAMQKTGFTVIETDIDQRTFLFAVVGYILTDVGQNSDQLR